MNPPELDSRDVIRVAADIFARVITMPGHTKSPHWQEADRGGHDATVKAIQIDARTALLAAQVFVAEATEHWEPLQERVRELRVRGALMKPVRLRDLRPCDARLSNCREKLGGTFYVIDTSLAVVDQGSVQRHMGMAQYFNSGGAPVTFGHALADVFGQEVQIKLAIEHDPRLGHRLYVCASCWVDLLGAATERAQRAREQAEAEGTGA